MPVTPAGMGSLVRSGTIRYRREIMMEEKKISEKRMNRLNLGLPGTNPDRLLHRYDEYLPVTDLPGAGGFGDR